MGGIGGNYTFADWILLCSYYSGAKRSAAELPCAVPLELCVLENADEEGDVGPFGQKTLLYP